MSASRDFGISSSALRRPIHALELALLIVVASHLVFLPWAVGGMRPWAQIPSLIISAISLVLALWPRTVPTAALENPTRRDAETPKSDQSSVVRPPSSASPIHGSTDLPPSVPPSFARLLPYPKLLRFPIFWLGLILFAYITIQALNPAWIFKTDGKTWHMQAVPYITWLPHGVAGMPIFAPVSHPHGGEWYMLILYASAWMTVCACWVGFTRRRPLQWLCLTLVTSTVGLAILGLAERFLHIQYAKLFGIDVGENYSSFVYKNHAGAYFVLTIGVTCATGLWYYFRGVRRMEKSTPGGIFAFAAVLIAVSLVVSYARGATLAMIVYLALIGCGFVIQQLFFAPQVTRKPAIVVALLLVFGFFLKTGMEAVNTGEAWDKVKAGFEDGGDYSFRSRMLLTKATAEMVSAHWLVGNGSGSFTFVFPKYQQKYPYLQKWPGARGDAPIFFSHAHNDWVEFPSDVGLIGMLVILAGLGWYALTLVRNYFWENPFSLALVLGLLAVLFYSYWDFPFQCPAILVTWCTLWAVVTKWTQLEEQRQRS